MSEWQPRSDLAKAVVAAGFLYDQAQDIIYSKHDAWQHKLGYTWAYDVAAAPLRMIIDCEPFYFYYDRRNWLIELWKGQYCLETGCEIGVYRDDLVTNYATSHPASRFYACVNPSDQLMMSLRLYKNGELLFKRGPESHWWLTGFHWGVYTANTHNLRMDLEIVFPKTEMRDAFKQAVINTGYNPTVQGKGISFSFQFPRTRQPASRKAMDVGAQIWNAQVVAGYTQLKKALKLTSNDPNGFSQLDGQVHQAAHQISRAASPIVTKASASLKKLEAASPAARKVHKAVAAAATELQHKLPEDAVNAYREIITFFDKKVWHCTR